MILRPQRNFTIVRQIANHTDTSTYYVRAVIRDAYTDVVLDTLNLANKTGQRFSLNWVVAPDPSGLGREISIVTSVYTNSTYTTKSENYGDEENSYLIEENNPIGRGGGTNLDAFTVRRIIKEELTSLEKAREDIATAEADNEIQAEIPEVEPMRWDDVLSAINELKTALKPQKPEKIDFKPLFKAIKSVEQAVNDKEVAEPIDISPIIKKLDEKVETDDLTSEEIVSLLNKLGSKLSKELPKDIKKILETATFKIEPGIARMELPKQEQQAKPIPFDLTKLTV